MKKEISNYFNKLFFKKWIIGICKHNIEDIIRNKLFNPDITWLRSDSFDKFCADPFFLTSANGSLKILIEEFRIDDNYGNISLMTLDQDFKLVNQKIIHDTNSHQSYPLVFNDNNKTYIFSETAQRGKLSCYEYDHKSESINFVQDIIDLPLRDSTVLKYNDMYWIFGTLTENGMDYLLHVFYSDNLFGPYKSHQMNPVKNGLDGTRSAGSFINVDGIIYRPSQNCQKSYGESIAINKIKVLSVTDFIEEHYMTIKVDINKRSNHGIHSIHTINASGNIIVMDGLQWIFSPKNQLKTFFRNRKTDSHKKFHCF